MQETYLDMLRSYLKLRRPTEVLLLPKVLMKLTELRSLNNSHSELLFQLKVKGSKDPAPPPRDLGREMTPVAVHVVVVAANLLEL